MCTFHAPHSPYHVPPATLLPPGRSVGSDNRSRYEAMVAAMDTEIGELLSVVDLDDTLVIFVADNGTAFVDLSKEAVTNHRGGSLDELFAVYAIVNAVTVNLPAVKGVQILVDGQEVDTLAGHVDLRHPLSRNMEWVGPLEGPEQE